MFGRRRTRLDEEIGTHLAEETAENIARGMDPAAARAAAQRTFGNVEAAKEKARELDPLYWLDTLWQDVRFAFRLIARTRWASLTIVATLTVGIALHVSVFSLLNAVFLRPWVQTDPGTFFSTPSTAPCRNPTTCGFATLRNRSMPSRPTGSGRSRSAAASRALFAQA
jgi:putative ABC transport system permease protein